MERFTIHVNLSNLIEIFNLIDRRVTLTYVNKYDIIFEEAKNIVIN